MKKKTMLSFLLILLILSGNFCSGSFTRSFIGQWKMNDNALSTTVVDSIGAHNGTFTDAAGDPNTSAHSAAGAINDALDFDGVDDYIAISDANSLDVTAITMSAWVNLDATASAGYVIAKMEDLAASGEVSYALHIDGSQKPSLAISDDGDNNTFEVANAAISVSVWHHIAGTYDGAGAYKIYVDGNLVGSDGNGSATGTIHVGTGRLTLGARYDSSASAYQIYFKGLIDNVMIFDKELSAVEIKYLYNGDNGVEEFGQRDNRGRYSGNPYRTRYNIN